MIAADSPRITLTSPVQAPAPSESIFGRLAALLTRAAYTAADAQTSDDEAVWTSVARGF